MTLFEYLTVAFGLVYSLAALRLIVGMVGMMLTIGLSPSWLIQM